MRLILRGIWLLMLGMCLCFSACAQDTDTLILPAHLKRVEAEAFLAGKAVKKVIVPEGTEEIASRAFAESAVEEIRLPVSLTWIADDAFDQAEPVMEVWPHSYAHRWAEEHGFEVRLCASPESDFSYTISSGEAAITAYLGEDEIVYLPDEIDGYPVTSLGAQAFAKQKQLRKVFLNDSLKTVGNQAFSNCNALEDAVFNEGLVQIGAHAFAYCENLLEADLPDSVEGIDDFAFRDCTSLVSFHYPASWTKINDHAPTGWYGGIFKECINLKEITVPEGVTKIRQAFFRECNHVETIHLPSTLTEIEARAFEGATALQTPELPDGITLIAESAYKLTEFETIRLPANLKTIGAFAFMRSKIKDVVFNEGLETIGAHAFAYCANLLEADLPDSVEMIDDFAFRDCTSLFSVHYPASWTKINDKAPTGWYGGIFKECTSLKEITVPEGVTKILPAFFRECNYVETIHLPSTLTEIGARAFEGTTSLKSPEIPDGVTLIDESAYKLTAFETIRLPANLKTIGAEAFMRSKIKDVVFNEGLETIGAHAFAYCKNLLEADLPDSVEMIDDFAFRDCTSLVSFHYPASWTKINDHAPTGWYGGIFKECINLKEITVPEGVTKILPAFFRECNYVETIHLPSTLTEIGARAFEGTTSLKSPEIPDGVRLIDESAYKLTAFETIRLPANLKTIGAEAFMRSQMKDVVFNDGLEKIGTHAFAYCENLLEADLPDSVEAIDDFAFRDCTSLVSFHYPASWTKINDHASTGWYGGIFKECTNLKEITVPEGVRTLFPRIFRECNQLTSISLPSTLRIIDELSLSGCSVMGDVYIAPAVTSIAANAFDGWKQLKIFCEWGTAALSHAVQKEIPYYYLSATGNTTLRGFYVPSDTIYRGDTHNMYGYIRSSIEIETITATLYEADGTVRKTVTVQPNEKNYNAGGQLGRQFSFGSLPLGDYSFSLKAATSETEETLISRSFTVAPPPLRVTVRGLEAPRGYLSAKDAGGISGTVVSNYPITSITVGVYAADGTATSQLYTAAPGTETFSLSQTGLDFSSLSGGSYDLIITVCGNGEKVTPVRRSFSLSDITIGDGIDIDLETFSAFIEDADHEYIFNRYTCSYRTEVMNSLSDSEKFALSMYTKEDAIVHDVINGFQLIASGDVADERLVKLYKKEIADFIANLGDVDDIYVYDQTIGDVVAQSVSKYGEIQTEYLMEYCESIQSDQLSFFERLNDEMKMVNFLAESPENIARLAGYLGYVARDFTAGLAVLDAMATELNSMSMQYEFQIALRELKEEFASRSYRAVSGVFDRAFEEAAEEAADFGIKHLLSLIAPELYVAYKAVDFAWDIGTELTGYYDQAEKLESYFIQLDTFSNANAAYQDCFAAVHNGDHSEEAVAQLILSFNVTKNAAIRSLETLKALNLPGVDSYQVSRSISNYKNLTIE